jgi:hypothetical protein
MPSYLLAALRAHWNAIAVRLPALATRCAASALFALLACGAAHAQGSVPLITVATDQSPLNLSDQFGIPVSTAINQAGDFAFVGNGDTALFLRPAGAPSATRLLQIYDEAPGFPGSQISSIWPEIGLNASRVLLFAVRFTGADKLPHSALLSYDGTNYHTLVTSDQPAPGGNGANYGLELVPGSIDDSGDVDFVAVSLVISTVPPIPISLYILPAGATTAVRIVGPGDQPPPACTWCSGSASSLGTFFAGVPAGSAVFSSSALVPSIPPLNARGQVLLSLWGGLFIGAKDGRLSLVPMAASGLCAPPPPPSTTTVLPAFGASPFLNNAGAVAFSNPPNSTSAAICVVPADATQGASVSAAVSSGDPAPAGVGAGRSNRPSPWDLTIPEISFTKRRFRGAA